VRSECWPLVGVHVVAPRHQRHRRPRRQCRRHDLPLQSLRPRPVSPPLLDCAHNRTCGHFPSPRRQTKPQRHSFKLSRKGGPRRRDTRGIPYLRFRPTESCSSAQAVRIESGKHGRGDLDGSGAPPDLDAPSLPSPVCRRSALRARRRGSCDFRPYPRTRAPAFPAAPPQRRRIGLARRRSAGRRWATACSNA